MSLVNLLLGVAVIALVGLLIYLVKQAVYLKTTADGLRAELSQFKEGGLNNLVRDHLALLANEERQRLESRERAIQQSRAELLEEQQKARMSAEQIHRELGVVGQQITTLSELQGRVGELTDLLKPQQLRGELGEVIVRALISDKLPKGQYEENYTFSDGKTVEFVIRLNEKLIPVDSKLQLEDFKRMRDASEERQQQACRAEFKRTVKSKIDEVKAYIQPDEGTYDFAFMVIPSEAVFYDLIANKDFIEEGGLYDYARRHQVFLVSPLTFWAYLTVLAQGLRGLEIGQRAEEILAGLQALSTKIRTFSQDEFRVLGGHLRNAAKQYEAAEGRLREIESGLGALERVESGEPVQHEVVG